MSYIFRLIVMFDRSLCFGRFQFGGILKITIFGNAAMPFLGRGVWFSPKVSYHSYICQFSIFLFVKNILHLYKQSRLSSSMFTFFRQFCIKIFCHNDISIKFTYNLTYHKRAKWKKGERENRGIGEKELKKYHNKVKCC